MWVCVGWWVGGWVCARVGSVAVALARQVACGSSAVELTAALLCYLLAFPFVGIPTSILLLNALLRGRMHRGTCELCAVWVMWNGGWLIYARYVGLHEDGLWFVALKQMLETAYNC
jgi:hypothetical protein